MKKIETWNALVYFKAYLLMMKFSTLEESTKLQSECLLWHKHCIGCITASKFGPVSRANAKCPRQSLVRSILSQSQLNSMKAPGE